MFPQLPVQPSTECTRTDTLHYDPIYFFDGTCHKTQSQTNCPPSIEHHRRHVQPLPPSIRLLSTCAPPPHRSSGTVSSPSCRSMSSPQSRSTTTIPTLIYCSRWVGTSSELGRRRSKGGGVAGYWVIVWLGNSLTVPELLPLWRSIRRRRARRKRGGQIRAMKRRAISHWMASMMLQG